MTTPPPADDPDVARAEQHAQWLEWVADESKRTGSITVSPTTGDMLLQAAAHHRSLSARLASLHAVEAERDAAAACARKADKALAGLIKTIEHVPYPTLQKLGIIMPLAGVYEGDGHVEKIERERDQAESERDAARRVQVDIITSLGARILECDALQQRVAGLMKALAFAASVMSSVCDRMIGAALSPASPVQPAGAPARIQPCPVCGAIMCVPTGETTIRCLNCPPPAPAGGATGGGA